jgi:hypothetical protein
MSVLLIQFIRIATWMGESNYEATFEANVVLESKLVRLKSGLEAVSKNTFWNSNCFAYALCAPRILKRDKKLNTIYGRTQRVK